MLWSTGFHLSVFPSLHAHLSTPTMTNQIHMPTCGLTHVWKALWFQSYDFGEVIEP